MALIDGQENRIRELAADGLRDDDIAVLLNCTPDDLRERFGNLLNKTRAERHLKISRAQMDFAEKGNATLLIWLGRNELQQTEKPQSEPEDSMPRFEPKVG